MVPHIPEPARAQADAFAHLLARDGYGPTAVLRMVGAIVDHARAVRLRCDAGAVIDRNTRDAISMLHREAAKLDSEDRDDVISQGMALWKLAQERSTDRIVHGLAKHTTTMTRRDLPRLATPTRYLHVREGDAHDAPVERVALMVAGEVSEPTRDAGHDLLAALICEVP